MLSVYHGGNLRWSKEPWLCKKVRTELAYEDRRIGKDYKMSAMRSNLNVVHVLLIFNYHHPTGISKIGLSFVVILQRMGEGVQHALVNGHW